MLRCNTVQCNATSKQTQPIHSTDKIHSNTHITQLSLTYLLKTLWPEWPIYKIRKTIKYRKNWRRWWNKIHTGTAWIKGAIKQRTDMIRDAIITCARTAQNQVWKVKKGLKSKEVKTDKYMFRSIGKQSGNPWSQSWRRIGKLWWEGFAEKEGFKPAVKEWEVMDDESGEPMEQVGAMLLKGLGESELERLVRGWRREAGSWFQRRGEAYRKERSVIRREDDVQCRWMSECYQKWRASAQPNFLLVLTNTQNTAVGNWQHTVNSIMHND